MLSELWTHFKTLFGPNDLEWSEKIKRHLAFQEENQISFSFQENENLRGLVPSRKENSMGRFCCSIEEEIEQGLSLPRSQEN